MSRKNFEKLKRKYHTYAFKAQYAYISKHFSLYCNNISHPEI